MIINRYLIREIGKPLLAVLSVLVVIFASYSAAEYLSDAVNGLLPNSAIAKLIALRTLIALEVLIPISLYISVIVSLGRLYSESEMAALYALGIGPGRVFGAVLTLSAVLAAGVACLSLYARPWAYEASHQIVARADADVNINDMEAGTFYESPKGNRVIYIGRREGPEKPMGDVFVQFERDHRTQIIHARQAYQVPGSKGAGRTITFIDAHVYGISRTADDHDRITHVKEMVLHLKPPQVTPPPYAPVAASSAVLSASHAPGDVSEFQWRLSTPLTTLLLGMLGVPLSRVKPRQGKYAKMGIAILVYSGYYLLGTSARTWVQKGVIGAFPGIWWVPALLAVILVIALAEPRFGFRGGRRPAWRDTPSDQGQADSWPGRRPA